MATKTTRQISDSEGIGAEDMRKHIAAFLLTDSDSKLANHVTSIYEHLDTCGQVIINGEDGLVRDNLEELLTSWGVELVPATAGSTMLHSAQILEIPDFGSRKKDLPNWVAFAIGRFFSQRGNSGTYPQQRLYKATADLVLWFNAYRWKSEKQLLLFIHQSLLRSRSEMLTFESAIENSEPLFKDISYPSPDMFAMYFGEYYMMDGVKEKLSPSDLAGCLLFAYRTMALDNGWIESYLRLPLGSGYIFDLNCVAQVLKNVSWLENVKADSLTANEVDRVSQCLHQYDAKLEDGVVASKLNFANQSKFQNWAEKYHLNRHFRQPDDVYEKHILAKEKLGLVKYSCNSNFIEFNLNGQILKANPTRSNVLRVLYEAGSEGVSARELRELTNQDTYETFRVGDGKLLREKLITYDPKHRRYYIDPRLKVIND